MYPVNHPLWEAWVQYCKKKNLILKAGNGWEIFLAGARASREFEYIPHQEAVTGSARRHSEAIDPR